MNKIRLFTFLILTLNSGLFAQSCTGFHKKACKSSSDQGWTYNSQSKSGLFEFGMSSELKIVIYKDFDYALSLCNERALGKGEIMLTMKDAKTGEMIYDNASDDRSQHIEFTCETTRSVIITVTAGGDGHSAKSEAGSNNKKTGQKSTGSKSEETIEGGCVGLLIEQKATAKEGF